MTLTCYPVPGKEKSRVICEAFKMGAPKSATGAVFFGTEGVMGAFQRAKSGTWWYIDNAYTDPQRGQYFRVTKNALQVDVMRPPAEWCGGCEQWAGKPMLEDCAMCQRTAAQIAVERLRHSTGERFAKLGITIKPWREKPDGALLVIPQSDDFMKSTLGKKGDWTADTLFRLRSMGFASRARVRPWLRDKKKAYIGLHQDLDSAALVITWSSASAITALYEGIPSISESGAMHALTGGLTLDNVARPKKPSDAERRRFLEVLADNQFTLDEFRDGTAWRWLERTQP